jgi:hypothetical protein
MIPDRSNYEIWFIDWLDGNLDEWQVHQLQEFLGRNQDLMEEFKTLAPVKLKPADYSCPRKERLRKRPADLTTSQFEYLCVAGLENDLAPLQAAELREAMADDPEKRKIYNLIQKLRLVPSETVYLHKSRLKRVSVYVKAFRISLALLSAAAAVALFLTLILPETVNIHQPAMTVASITIPPAITKAPVPEPAEVIIPEVLTTINLYSEVNDAAVNDTVQKMNPDFPRITLSPAPMPGHVNIAGRYEAKSSLIEYKYGPAILLFPDERSNVDKFFARLFHEKIMRDTTAGDRPVKGYEIAEAGIAGLNKLLGTELALQRNTDENGEVSSVYFSSGLLKFTAPVKKSGTFQ